MRRLSRQNGHVDILAFLWFATVIACSIASAQQTQQGTQLINPKNWIPDQFKPSWMTGEQGQAWSRVLIWDPALGAKRGIRAVLMPVVENEDNVPIDRRMTLQMKGYMQQFCEDVITVLDIEDPVLRDRLDQTLNACINQWKQFGRIDPEGIAQLAPDILIDVVVLFERNIYDQGWRGDRKIFRVGLVGVAFGADTGDVIFRGEVLEESPWSGMQNTIFRVERQATLALLRKLRDRFVEIGTLIDNRRMAEQQAAQAAADEETRKRLAALHQEETELRRLSEQAAGILLSATEPLDVLQNITTARNALLESLRVPAASLTEEQLNARRRAAADLNVLLADYKKYADEQERIRNLPPPDRPIEAPPELPGKEEPASGNLLIDFTNILTPTPVATPTPRNYVPPGAFDLPVRTYQTPLPPLRTPTATSTPTPEPRARRVGTARPLGSAPAALPLSTTSSGALPANRAVEIGPAVIRPATLENIIPPSDEQLREIERLRRKIAPLELPSSTASTHPAGEMFDITPERRIIPLSPSG